jgi:hypothetical protein
MAKRRNLDAAASAGTGPAAYDNLTTICAETGGKRER